MAQLIPYTLTKDGLEKTVNLYPTDDPANCVAVTDYGWKVKTATSKEAEEIIKVNQGKVKEKQSQDKRDSDGKNDINPSGKATELLAKAVVEDLNADAKKVVTESINEMRVVDLKGYLDDNKVEYAITDKKPDLLKKALEYAAR